MSVIITKNLFYKYEQAENSLTRGFLFALTEHEGFREQFFRKIDIEPSNRIKINLQQEAGKSDDSNRAKSVLDAQIVGEDFLISVESKKELKITQKQLNNHIEGLEKKKGFKKNILLLITENKNDLKNLKSDSKKVILEKRSWQEIFKIGKTFLPKCNLSSTSDYILNQFLELLSDEFQFFLGLSEEELKVLRERNYEKVRKKIKNLHENVAYLTSTIKAYNLEMEPYPILRYDGYPLACNIHFSDDYFLELSLGDDDPIKTQHQQFIELLKKWDSDENFISNLNSLKDFRAVLIYWDEDGHQQRYEEPCAKIKSFSHFIRKIKEIEPKLEEDWYDFGYYFELNKPISQEDLKDPFLPERLAKDINYIEESFAQYFS